MLCEALGLESITAYLIQNIGPYLSKNIKIQLIMQQSLLESQLEISGMLLDTVYKFCIRLALAQNSSSEPMVPAYVKR